MPQVTTPDSAHMLTCHAHVCLNNFATTLFANWENVSS